MNKPERAMLERLFAAEVDAALNNRSRIVQAENAAMRSLVAQGYAEPAKEAVGRAFKVTISGYVLTPSGHEAYCVMAADEHGGRP